MQVEGRAQHGRFSIDLGKTLASRATDFPMGRQRWTTRLTVEQCPIHLSVPALRRLCVLRISSGSGELTPQTILNLFGTYNHQKNAATNIMAGWQRTAECTGLKNRQVHASGFGGSNPSPFRERQGNLGAFI